MPDAAGNFKGISVPAEAWDRIFGQGPARPTGADAVAFAPPPPEEPPLAANPAGQPQPLG